MATAAMARTDHFRSLGRMDGRAMDWFGARNINNAWSGRHQGQTIEYNKGRQALKSQRQSVNQSTVLSRDCHSHYWISRGVHEYPVVCRNEMDSENRQASNKQTKWHWRLHTHTQTCARLVVSSAITTDHRDLAIFFARPLALEVSE